MSSGYEWALGVDIGGTNVKIALVNRGGAVKAFHTFLTPRSAEGVLDTAALANRVAELIDETTSWGLLAGAGVGVPGILNEERTEVRYAVNLGLKNTPLKQLLQERWSLPVTLDSDVMMGASGEHRYGAASGFERFLYISIGTGIGACLYENGGFYRNSMGGPLNIGHTVVYPDGIACACGNQGCLEQYVSGLGLAGRYAERAGIAGVTVERMSSLAEEGDPLARELLADAGQALGIALLNLGQVFGACPIVVGGGLSRIRPLLDRAARVYADRGKSILASGLEVRAAEFPDKAGVLGAASAVFLKA